MELVWVTAPVLYLKLNTDTILQIKRLLVLFVIILFYSTASAHYIWIEVADKWAIGKSGTIKIYYEEYAKGTREKAGQRLEEANGLTAWIVTPGVEKINLTLQKMRNHFLGRSTPSQAASLKSS